MSQAAIQYQPVGRDGFSVTIHSVEGSVLTLAGSSEDAEPRVEGEARMAANPALVLRALAYGKNEWMYRRSRSPEKRASYAKQAVAHAAIACAIADMVVKPGPKMREAWCSACFAKTTHREVAGFELPPAYLCGACGSPTARCAAPRCSNMANRNTGKAKVPKYCAEHRHDIPRFSVDFTISTIDEYDQLLAYRRRNMARGTRVVGGVTAGGAVLAPMALIAAPAIGGALGASVLGGGLSGAAAVSHGLAMLGGGSLAAGGFGMAGGTAVVTTVGAGLGGALGATTTTAYVRSDPSFRIQKLRDGDGATVLLSSGFLTEDDDGWGPWERIVNERFPTNPVYRVHWGSKELKDLQFLVAAGASKAAIAKVVTHMAAKGSKSAAGKVPGLGMLMTAQGFIANPWTVAKARADMTGQVLAYLISHTRTERFILVGHSLGGRTMLKAAQILGTIDGPARLESVQLLGAAAPAKGDRSALNDSVTETVWNYFSKQDWVLKTLYSHAQLAGPAAGAVGFQSKFPRIRDKDVTAKVPSHSLYLENVKLQ